MPKLSSLQWLLFVLFLFFYGFTVFAVTRDYYVRTMTRPAIAAVSGSPHGAVPQSTRAPQVSAIPQALTESNPELLRQQGDTFFSQGQYAEAVPVFQRIIELSPDDVDAHNDMGLALYYTGDTAGALTRLRAGAAKDPSHQRVWLTLGFVSLQAEALDEAREALSHARGLDPDTGMGREASRLLELIAD